MPNNRSIDELLSVLESAVEHDKLNAIENNIRVLTAFEAEPVLPTLKRVAFNPTQSEKQENVDLAARECLEYLGVHFACAQ